MAIVRATQTNFSQGELSHFMQGRYDNKAYAAGLRTLENWIILPQGGVMRRPPFQWINTITTVANSAVRLGRFAFSRAQEYVLVFTNNSLSIFRNSVFCATITTTYAASELQDIRFFNSTDTMIIVHANHKPAKLFRQGSDASWAFSDIVFTNIPFYRYNQNQTCTNSAVSGSCTLTLSGATGYWTANHVGTTVLVNGGTATISSIASGLVANATIPAAVPGGPATATTADAAWSEQAWSAAHGFPLTAVIHQNRLFFGGTRDAPSTLFGSNTGDFFNSTATTLVSGVNQTEDNNCVVFTFSTDQVHTVVNLWSGVDLICFTNQGEFRVWGGGIAGSGITPGSIQVVPQSNYGSASVPIWQVDLQVVYATVNGKEVRGAAYQYIYDKYISEQFTILAGDIFLPATAPVSMCMLRGYSSTQANYIFVIRKDGQAAVLCIDNAKDVLGWSRFVTQGQFLSCTVVAKVDPISGFINDTLYVAVQRANGIFLEEMSDVLNTSVRMDCYQTQTAVAQTNWSGLTQLKNQIVQIIADGLVAAPATVSNTGTFSIAAPAAVVSAGLGYTSTLVTLPYSFSVENKVKRGLPMRKVRGFFILDNTETLIIDGYTVPFRFSGAGLLDAPLAPFTGSIEVKLGTDSYAIEQLLTATVTDPLPATILAITADVEVRDEP